ncbi:MAG: carbohydrate ABC transporter permease [Oscillospiraceae bacterium]|nr:carbohydrate ABC transporter permease [Oscillospiraceae bacterium]
MKTRVYNIILRAVSSIVYIVTCVIMFLPIYYLIVTTFKSPAEAAASPLGLPIKFTFENYVKALGVMKYARALTNNLIILVFSVLLLIVCSSMAAYVIARSRKKRYRILFSIFLVGLIVPYQTAIIPLYKIVAGLHLMNTHAGVILIDTFCINLPLSIFLFRGFIDTIPLELEEAASIDGYGTLRIFWVITFPLLKPIVATVAILDSLAVWNDFMTPLLFLQSPEKGVLLQEVYKNVGPFRTDWTSFFPMLVLATLPLVLLYLFLQRHIIDSVVAGALKG